MNMNEGPLDGAKWGWDWGWEVGMGRVGESGGRKMETTVFIHQLKKEWWCKCICIYYIKYLWCYERRNRVVQIPWTFATFLGFSLSKPSQRVAYTLFQHFTFSWQISLVYILYPPIPWTLGNDTCTLHLHKSRVGSLLSCLTSLQHLRIDRLSSFVKHLFSWLPGGHTPSFPPAPLTSPSLPLCLLCFLSSGSKYGDSLLFLTTHSP